MAITGTQIRMARAALRWRVDDLADKTGLTWARIQQMERAEGIPSAPAESIDKVRHVLETAGIRFLDAEQAEGEGVLLKSPTGRS